MKKKISKLFLIFVIATAFIFNLTSMDYSSKYIDTSNKASLSKIDPLLLEHMELNENNSNQDIAVSIWLNEPNTGKIKENTNKQIEKYSADYKTYCSQQKEMDTVHKIKNDYREQISKVYYEYNETFVKRNTEIASTIFISRYAPMIIVYLNEKEIYEISSNSSVKYLCYYDKSKYEFNNTNGGYPAVSQNLIQENTDSALTGSGITIGVFDAGIPNENEIIGMNVGGRLGSYNGTHPGFMASILKSIAPGAKYYFTGHNNFPSMFSYVEWLLDQGVDIINMSLLAGSDGNNNYGNDSRWYDHIAYNHYVLIVNAAGNNSAVVGCPAMAYNNITVGSVELINNNYSLASFSGYYTGDSFAFKPDICAVGPEGTSAAAPKVTATAALLMQANSTLAFAPEELKAILLASVDMDTLYHFVPSERLASEISYMQIGAGILNATNAINTVNNNQSKTDLLSFADITNQYTFNVSSSNVGKTTRITLAYSIPVNVEGNHITGSVTAYTIPDLDLYVYGPNGGTLLEFSTVSCNNVEILEFVPQYSGNYTIKVTANSSSNPNVNIPIGLAWIFN